MYACTKYIKRKLPGWKTKMRKVGSEIIFTDTHFDLMLNPVILTIFNQKCSWRFLKILI